MGSTRESQLRALGAEVARVLPVAEVMKHAVSAWAESHGLCTPQMAKLRLFRAARSDRRRDSTPAHAAAKLAAAFTHGTGPEDVGGLYEALLDATSSRKRSGSFFTPHPIAERVVRVALERCQRDPLQILVCDPSLGGGSFLLEAGRRLVALAGDAAAAPRRHVAEHCLTGIDLSPLAVAVAEAVLWLWVGDPSFDPSPLSKRLVVGDALERGWQTRLLRERQSFDLVVGNPPWIAYAGRAAQPLEPTVRRRYAAQFGAFRGYPTLHGMFVERASELAPSGVVALVLPSPLADLDGYRPVRRRLAKSHAPREPLLELGQDAFFGVTQPSFALIADPGADSRDGDRPWRLSERQRAQAVAAELAVPSVLERLSHGRTFPPELFREMGFQSAGDVAKRLFFRADAPARPYTIPLLEGREVSEFRAGSPRLFLHPDPEVLARARCRLRPVEQYRGVSFVVRQTAKYPIAALHHGSPFRNTLLAGFAHEELRPGLVVALLNSSLYRALHLALRRDARQAVFPQVKIGHLRALPRPPAHPEVWAELEQLTERATAEGASVALRMELDRRVFGLFALEQAEREAILGFLAARAPELARAPRSRRRGRSSTDLDCVAQ